MSKAQAVSNVLAEHWDDTKKRDFFAAIKEPIPKNESKQKAFVVSDKQYADTRCQVERWG